MKKDKKREKKKDKKSMHKGPAKAFERSPAHVRGTGPPSLQRRTRRTRRWKKRGEDWGKGERGGGR